MTLAFARGAWQACEMEWFDWRWALGLALWTLLVFRIGMGMGRLTSRAEDIMPISTTRISPEARSQIDDALRRGRKVEAIRILRKDTGCGLAEAKKTVETLRG